MSAGYPTPTTAFPTTRLRSPSGETAGTLVLVALILEVIGAAAMVIGIGWLVGVAIFYPFAYSWVALLAAGVFGALAIVYLYLTYALSYQRIHRGEYEAAQTPTLVLGIIALFLGVIPGILFLVGYVKLTDAIREQRMAGMAQYPLVYPVPPPPPSPLR